MVSDFVNWLDQRNAAHSTGDGWGLWLTDKHFNPVADLHGCNSLSFEDKVNAVGVMEITLPGDHPAVAALLPLDLERVGAPEAMWGALVDSGQFLIFEGPGGASERIVGRVARITDTRGQGGHGTVTVEAKTLYRHVEKIACYPTPGAPLVAQLKYRDYRAGDSLRVIKEYLLVNLMREFQPGLRLGWKLWDMGAWRSLVDPSRWPLIVNPVHASNTTQNTVLDARMDLAADLFSETLDAAGLLLTANLWLPGDKQPEGFPVTLTTPIIILDVVPRQFDTSTTGGGLDFLRGLVRSFDRSNNAPRRGLGDTKATAAGVYPWVVWRPEDMGAMTSDFTVVKSEDSHVIVGGRSPEVLNKAISAGTKAAFHGLAGGLAAAFPQFSILIGAAGEFFGEAAASSLQDKLFAWQEFSDSVRMEAQGPYRYRTSVGSGDGWTLSAWQQAFQMLQQGAGMMSVGFTTSAQTIYKWGRDYRAGDQQGLVHRGALFATYVSEAKLSWSVSSGWREELTLGDPRARESWARGYARSLKSISNAVSRVKSFVM